MSFILRLCYISLVTYCFISIEGLITNKPAWYRSETRFSDWRNIKKVDYSTNAVVANWYSGGHSKYFRNEELKEINKKLSYGDTITVGLDYYYLFRGGIHLDNAVLKAGTLRFDNDEVITIKIWRENYSINYAEF
jgi:hypothetical protein